MLKKTKKTIFIKKINFIQSSDYFLYESSILDLVTK